MGRGAIVIPFTVAFDSTSQTSVFDVLRFNAKWLMVFPLSVTSCTTSTNLTDVNIAIGGSLIGSVAASTVAHGAAYVVTCNSTSGYTANSNTASNNIKCINGVPTLTGSPCGKDSIGQWPLRAQTASGMQGYPKIPATF
jgi:hypothetical protein